MEQPSLFTLTLTVSELNRCVKDAVEQHPLLQGVWVKGEISNLSRPSSGHLYFTLKDPASAVKCVIWKTNAMRLRTPLQNGQAVEVHGTVSVYERDGIYQIYVDAVRLSGEGWLYQEFMRLKARLEAAGLFDEERKRPLPQLPQRIGIVTSPTGAALQDMLNTLTRRYRLADVILAPTPVQGDDAPPAIVRALQTLTALPQPPDVILVARGGGSLEDLWAFNDERVVIAIAASPIPIVTGIGHETDFTLADFAADQRAPTPTAAAVLATPNSEDLRQDLYGLQNALILAAGSLINSKRMDGDSLSLRMERRSPAAKIQSDRQHMENLQKRAGRAVSHTLSLQRTRLHGLHTRIQALHPLAILQRGYAVVRRPDGTIIHSTMQVRPGDEMTVQVQDGQIISHVIQTHPLIGG